MPIQGLIENIKSRQLWGKTKQKKNFFVTHVQHIIIYSSKNRFKVNKTLNAYESNLMLGPLGLCGGCQETARKDSLMATTDSGARPWGLVGNVVAGEGRLSVHPPTYPPPLEHTSTLTL